MHVCVILQRKNKNDVGKIKQVLEKFTLARSSLNLNPSNKFYTTHLLSSFNLCLKALQSVRLVVYPILLA